MADNSDTSPYKPSRELSEEEKSRLGNDTRLVTEFKQLKLEKEAQKNWDLFYKRNTTKFYKDRHWTTREFKELCGGGQGEGLTILEVGCGVGNFLYPLVEDDESVFFYACDFSPRAVQFVKEHPLYASGRVEAFQCDLTKDTLSLSRPVDLVTMIFVLSAIHPDRMLDALKNIYSAIRPGGVVLFRDYAQYDFAQLRFKPGNKLGDDFYVRQDGTRAFYFTKERLEHLFTSAGFAVLENDYVFRETVNKKEGLAVPRIFVQSRFVKPEKCSEAKDNVSETGKTSVDGDSVQQSNSTEGSDNMNSDMPAEAQVDTS